MDGFVTETPQSTENVARPCGSLTLRIYSERNPIPKEGRRIALAKDDWKHLLFAVRPDASEGSTPLSLLPRSSPALSADENDKLLRSVDGAIQFLSPSLPWLQVLEIDPWFDPLAFQRSCQLFGKGFVSEA